MLEIFVISLLEEERQFDSVDAARGDAAFSFGSFLVTKTGVTAVLKPPLSRLSGHHEWSRVALGLGLLKLFFTGSDSGAADRFTTWFLTNSEKEEFEQLLCDHEETWEAEVHDLMGWGANLTSRCPYQSVCHDLERLPVLADDLLDDFIRRNLRR